MVPAASPAATAFSLLTLQGISTRTVQMSTALSACGHSGLHFLYVVDPPKRESLVLAVRWGFGDLNALNRGDVAAQN